MTTLEQLRIISSVACSAFFAILVFVELANFYIDRMGKHLLLSAMWLVLVVIFVVRALSVPKMLDPAQASLTISILLLFELGLAIWWGIVVVVERVRRVVKVRRILKEKHHHGRLESG